MPTQLEWLDHDLAEFRRVAQENWEVFSKLGDGTDPARQNYHEVVVDLVWRILYLCAGAAELLREELRDPLLLVQRGIFEALVTLGYLTLHEQPEREAQVLRAFGYLKQLKLFADDSVVVAEREKILARMPAEIVEEAKHRLSNRPRTWSGITLRKMSESSGVEGYHEAYDWLSAEAHVSIAGERVRWGPEEGGKARLSLGHDLSERDHESAANFARRALRGSLARLWTVLDGPPIRFNSEHPDAWWRDQVDTS